MDNQDSVRMDSSQESHDSGSTRSESIDSLNDMWANPDASQTAKVKNHNAGEEGADGIDMYFGFPDVSKNHFQPPERMTSQEHRDQTAHLCNPI
ncbi:hypothetical protein ACLMJK_006365 [Lecanora helva]